MGNSISHAAGAATFRGSALANDPGPLDALNHLLQTFGSESMDPHDHHTARILFDLAERYKKSRRKAVGWTLSLDKDEGDTSPTEALFEISRREVIPAEAMRPWGPLRGIVKVIVTLNGGGTIVGTGVLIRPNVVAVVGHLLENEKGHAVHVSVHAGYGSGPELVETRRGISATVHYAWYNNRSPANDLAFIRLQADFNNGVRPIPFRQTPIPEGNVTGRILGYSGDVPSYAPGQHLCQSRSAIQYTPSDASGLGMLEHKADTAQGASGGAVLDDDDWLIGLHTGWSRINDQANTVTNSAVTIDREGNDFGAFLDLLVFMELEESHRIRPGPMSDIPLTELLAGQFWTPKLSEKLDGARWKSNNGRAYSCTK